MTLKPLLLALYLSIPLVAQAQDSGRDARILAARDAAKANDKAKLERLAQELQGHELAPWASYWALKANIEQVDAGQIREFLSRNDKSFVAERLRMEWLRQLAKRAQWADFESEFTKLRTPDQDVACHALRNRIENKDKAAALEEALPLWLGLLEPPEPCRLVLEALIWDKKVLADHVWQRARRQLEANRPSWAKATLFYLPASQTPDGRQIDQVVDKPAVYLATLGNAWESNRASRELAAMAIGRLARNDPAYAAEQLKRIQSQLHAPEKSWAWGQVGWQAALKHLPEAANWYALSSKSGLSDEVAQWKVRAALRAGNWAMVQEAVEHMNHDLAARPDWVYWLGRAHKAQGRLEQANGLFLKIAGQPNFYGNLADEELGRSITAPPKARAVTPEEQEKAGNTPGLRRALALIRLDIRSEGVAEWNWSLRGMDDRELLAAADYARRNQVFDRAISAADRTRNEHDYSLRYLAPYADQVRPAAKNQSLDDAWVYGLMRQESRFVTTAKSSAGASGLMQLMPATARWVANKVGLRDFSQGKVNDTEVNVLLGTTYMRLVMESLDQHPVLASAAYNAGPGRARKWKAEKPLEGAIYAETIPFNETRDYVKKVMSNAVYYSVLFNGKAESLKSRLGVIAPKSTVEAQKTEELP